MRSLLNLKVLILIIFLFLTNGFALENKFLKDQSLSLPNQAEMKSEEKKEMKENEMPKKAKEIIDFSIDEKKDFTTFTIIADGTLGNYNAFRLDSPPRLVLDIWDVGNQFPKNIYNPQNSFIKEVRIGQHHDKLRFVFDSLNPQFPPYQIIRADNKLIVSLGNVPQVSEPQILLKWEKEGGVETLSSNPKAKEEISSQKETISPKAIKTIAMTGIDFKQMDNKSRIIVTLSGEPKFETYKISKDIIVLDIRNAFSPKHLSRGLDTSEFEGAVNFIDIKNIKTSIGNDLRILIRLKEEMPFETTQEGKRIFVDIEKPKRVIESIPVKEEIKKEEVKEEVKREEVKEEEVKPVPSPVVVKKTEEGKKVKEEGPPEKVYTGRKISLDFKDADIRNILRLIAEVSNLNIITADDVTGKITMRLMDVPWDQALDVILETRGLGMVQVGNVIRIAPIETLNKESQTKLEAKRAKEKLEDLVTELIPVNYATAKDIIPQVKGVLSERGDVKVDERTNILIVKDIAKNIPEVKNLVKSLDTKTPQVLIEARIIEANLTFQRELGVSWGFEATSSSDRAGNVRRRVIVGGGTNTPSTTPGATTDMTLGSSTSTVVNLPAVARGGVPGTTGATGVIEFLLTSIHGLRELDIAISAHENKGDVKIISSPKIATLHNKEASIEQGLRIPYRKLTTEGTITTDFIDANLKLTVTPLVTNDGHIKLNIKAKKDAPDQSIVVDGVPSIDKKEAITEVLVKDNGVVVIAGVYSIEKSEGVEGIPLLSKIPLLGWLFKREAKEDKRKDLLIFISPKILKDQI